MALKAGVQVKGLLVRVGIDSADGSWNAPMRVKSGEFAYVTISENVKKQLRGNLARYYDEFVSAAASFGEQLPRALLERRPTLIRISITSLMAIKDSEENASSRC
jgi:hypothetical protein